MVQLFVNCGHPLSGEAAVELREHIGEFETVMVRIQLDVLEPLAEQVADAITAVGVSSEAWQTRGVVVALPGMSVAAALIVAEVHGRTGSFPRVVHLVRGGDGVFHLGEVIDLMTIRGAARQTR
jgi:hypothetical protein